MSNIVAFNGYLKKVADTYNYSNSSTFYSLVSFPLQQYYEHIIKPSQEWLDGYVCGFHDRADGIVSTRIGSKIAKGLTRQVFGRGLIFINGRNTTNYDAMDYISKKWSKETDFQNVVKNCIGYCLPLGTSVIKINKSANGDLWCDALRIDYFDFAVDSRNDLQSLTCYIRAYSDTKSNNYVLVEHRYFQETTKEITTTINGKKLTFQIGERIPMVEYKVKLVPTTSNQNFSGVVSTNDINFKSLPSGVLNAIKKDYQGLMLDTPQILPFKDYLGAELFRNEGGDSTHPSLPFGAPLMYDCIADFMEYDMEKSYAMRDLYNSRGIVGIPKMLSQASLIGDKGGIAKSIETAGYEMIEGLDPNTQKPIITQFEIRAQEHEIKQNSILKSIATAVGLSPRIIASYLLQGVEKTATQIDSEDDTITEWVKSHRQDYIRGLNRIIETILTYKGYIGNVEVRFANDGLINAERQMDMIDKKMQLNLITLEDAVREIYPDLDENQLQIKINNAYKQKKEQEQLQFVNQTGTIETINPIENPSVMSEDENVIN